MTEYAVESTAVNRDRSFDILKAFAIVFVVVAHSGGPSWLVSAAYIFSVPVFFMCTGYFFALKYLDAPKTYLWKRVKKIYWPFWVWSVVFLVLHNFFFWIGLLSEEYGNAVGGVTHTFTWHAFTQRLWNVTFNMSGYDPFLSGAFWFFRTLFIGSIAFYFLFMVLQRFSKWKSPVVVAVTIMGLSFLLGLWKVVGQIQITGIAQGGYRELMALVFMSAGFLYRQYRFYLRPRWLVAVLGTFVLCLFVVVSPSSMGYTATLEEMLSLPLPAVGAFLALHVFSEWLAGTDNCVSRSLVYIGERTLYIFAFHLLSFKLVSIVKVLVYDLPWSHVGGHPIVHDYPGDLFFLLYILAGVALPLLFVAGWKRLDRKYDLTWLNCLNYIGRGLLLLLNFFEKIIIGIGSRLWKSIKDFFKDLKAFIKASNPKDE